MRVTSNMMFTAGVGALQSQQQEMMRIQEQSSSGQKINRPSDDPSGTFRHVLFSTNLSGVQSLQKTSNLASQRLTMGDIKIGEVHESMLQAQDLVMRYAHSSVGGDPNLLKLFAQDAFALYGNVMSTAKSELDGIPVFGGGRTDTPFDEQHLKATQVRMQTNGEGTVVKAPAWYAFSASVSESGFTPPSEQVEGELTSYKVSVSAGQYEVEINGVRQEEPASLIETSGAVPVLDLGHGAFFSLGSTPREGDVFSFNVAPDRDGFKATHVERQGSHGATSVSLDATYSVPAEQEDAEAATSFKILYSKGKYDVEINGVRQEASLSVIEQAGRPPFLDLGNGAEFNIGDIPKEGDIYAFDVATAEDGFRATPVQLQRYGGVKDLTDFYAGYTATIDDSHTISDVPLSVKVSYLSANQSYEVDINGIKQPHQRATGGQPSTLNLGNGITFNIIGKPNAGDVFYFEVVPEYRGGAEDRPVQISNGKTLPGNVTGSELLEGTGSLGRDVNILGALAALRGAFLRADPDEVAVQLDRIKEGGAQASDFQAITGVRGVQVEATNAILTIDEASLQEAKANNSDVDLFEVMSHLQQVSQAMQMMATAQRQVLNTSLIDFIR